MDERQKRWRRRSIVDNLAGVLFWAAIIFAIYWVSTAGNRAEAARGLSYEETQILGPAQVIRDKQMKQGATTVYVLATSPVAEIGKASVETRWSFEVDGDVISDGVVVGDRVEVARHHVGNEPYWTYYVVQRLPQK